MKQVSLVSLAITCVFACGQPTAPATAQPAQKGAPSGAPGKAPAASSKAPASGSTRPLLKNGPPWGEFWCTRAESFWSQELSQRFFPASAKAQIDYDLPECDPSVDISFGDAKASVSVHCGAGPLQHKVQGKPSPFPSEGLGQLYARVAKQNGRWLIEGRDVDVPCEVVVSWQEPANPQAEAQATAFTKEVLKRLTPASIGRPRAEIVVTAVDESGARAKAELARWSARKPGVEAIMTLAPGYPRIARSEEFKGAPPGKHFLLLAVCPSKQGQNAAQVLQGVFPRPPPDPMTGYDVELHNVDGQGLSNDCPPEVTAGSSPLGTTSMLVMLPNDRVMTIASVQDDAATPGTPHNRFVAFLFSPEREVLDFKVGQVLKPVDLKQKGRFWPEATRRHDKCRAGVASDGTTRIGYSCEVYWSDYLCAGQKESWEVVHSFRATPEGKLTMTSSEGTRGGTLCKAPE